MSLPYFSEQAKLLLLQELRFKHTHTQKQKGTYIKDEHVLE